MNYTFPSSSISVSKDLKDSRNSDPNLFSIIANLDDPQKSSSSTHFIQSKKPDVKKRKSSIRSEIQDNNTTQLQPSQSLSLINETSGKIIKTTLLQTSSSTGKRQRMDNNNSPSDLNDGSLQLEPLESIPNTKKTRKKHSSKLEGPIREILEEEKAIQEPDGKVYKVLAINYIRESLSQRMIIATTDGVSRHLHRSKDIGYLLNSRKDRSVPLYGFYKKYVEKPELKNALGDEFEPPDQFDEEEWLKTLNTFGQEGIQHRVIIPSVQALSTEEFSAQLTAEAARNSRISL